MRNLRQSVDKIQALTFHCKKTINNLSPEIVKLRTQPLPTGDPQEKESTQEADQHTGRGTKLK
jgi:hypothetical protein